MTTRLCCFLSLCLLWIATGQCRPSHSEANSLHKAAQGLHPSKAEGSAECHSRVADVVFLLDSSYSIWQHQFATQLSFLSQLVSDFTIGPAHIRVGVVTFSTNVRLDLALNQHFNKTELQAALGRIEYMKGGTRTGDAIRFAHTQMFSKSKGGRKHATHILILITDGYSYNPAQTAQEAASARRKGIQIFAVGVGTGVDENELRAIASDPDESHVFHVENYSGLKHIEKSLAKQTCHKAKPSDSMQADSGKPEVSKDDAVKRCGGKPADIFLVLDSSSSIWSVSFGEMLKFATQLTQLFDVGPGRTRVGVAVFSDEVQEVMSWTDPQDNKTLSQAILQAPYLKGGTETAEALRYVRTQKFSQARPGVAHVILILTDGQSANPRQTVQEANAAHEQGIYVFSVGIGASTDEDELRAIASDPDEDFMFHVDNFEGLHSIQELLAMKTCDVPDVQGDQPASVCGLKAPTDMVFVYDAGSVSRAENQVMVDLIQGLVHDLDPNPDLVRWGLVRDTKHCHHDANLDLSPGADVDRLKDILQNPVHCGLHTLLRRARLHAFSAPDDVSSDVEPRHKVLVLLLSSKLEDSGAVEKELKRLKHQGVRVLVVGVGAGGRQDADLLTPLTPVPPVLVDAEQPSVQRRQLVLQAVCQLYRGMH